MTSVKQYTTTDGRKFTGLSAKQKSLDHQRDLIVAAKIKATHDRLVDHLHETLGLDPEPKHPNKKDICYRYNNDVYENDYEKWSDAYDDYCAKCEDALSDIDAVDFESVSDLANMLSSFFFLIGRKKWNGIASILELSDRG